MKQSKTVIRDIKNLFEQEKEDYYKSVIIIIIWNSNNIEYEGNCDRNKLDFKFEAWFANSYLNLNLKLGSQILS